MNQIHPQLFQSISYLQNVLRSIILTYFSSIGMHPECKLSRFWTQRSRDPLPANNVFLSIAETACTQISCWLLNWASKPRASMQMLMSSLDHLTEELSFFLSCKKERTMHVFNLVTGLLLAVGFTLKNDQRVSILFLFKAWLFCSYIVY